MLFGLLISMLHTCHQCHIVYLASDYFDLCNQCGYELQQQIERLFESDEAVEFSTLCSMAQHGIEPERTRVWWAC